MSYYGFPQYVTVAEKKRKARQALEKLRKKQPDIAPVVIEGRKLARTWWGKAWNDNLERYADYANRIDRGRSYVRNGAVLDLKLEKGTAVALVQGSTAKPYRVQIEIRPIPDESWGKITMACAGQIESLQELLDGKFPRALSELFTARGSGLFPTPKEIRFSCSCPDWAVMCKHVAAALYGIGARLDEDPALFFTLRSVNVEALISRTIESKTQALLDKTASKSRRILAGADLASVFGIEVEGTKTANVAETEKAVETAKATDAAPKRRGRPKKKGRSL